MKELHVEKLQKDASSNSKSSVAKVSKRKGVKVEGVTTRPSLPKGMKYVIQHIPLHPLRFGSPCNRTFLDDFKLSIKEEGIELFRQTIFGKYLSIPQCNFQGQIIKCLLLLELEQNNPDELHVRHANGNVLSFSINEFALITGLKCTGNISDFEYPNSPSSRLMEKYFPGAKIGVKKNRLVQRFLMGGWDTNEDAVQMAILYFIHTFLFSQTGDAPISIDDFKMVEDGRYRQFPWGQLAFSKLMKSLRQKFNVAKQLYRLGGMPYALNVWMYECSSEVHPDIAIKEGNHIPRILNWRVVGVKPKCETFMGSMFSKNVCTNIAPTQEELVALHIPGTVGVISMNPSISSIPIKSAVELKQLDTQPTLVDVVSELSGFEHFSTNPPDELLKKSKRVIGPSLAPPTKRRKNFVAPKPIPVELELSISKSNQSQINSETPTTSADDVHAPHSSPVATETDFLEKFIFVSSDKNPKEHMTKADLKEVKTYLKKYIGKKFCDLETLIKSQHAELLNAFKKQDHPHVKDNFGTVSPNGEDNIHETCHVHCSIRTDSISERPNPSDDMKGLKNGLSKADAPKVQQYNVVQEAKEQESKILLKLLVDEKKDQVVAAESGVDFMDILVSLLTLPLGTIIRLIKAEAGTVGCMNNLYRSVENLDEEDLFIEHCKTMLLNPTNPHPKYCMKLKVNLDDSGSKYYKCSDCRCNSYYMNVECKCNGKYNKETFLKDSGEDTCCDKYVFLKGGISFLVSDDLQVKCASPSSLVQMLSNVGLSGMNQIKEMHVEVSKNEVIHLLMRSLISKTPLSDVFLPKQKQKRARVDTMITMYESGNLSSISENRTSKKLELKLTVRKSTQKVLCAEAGNDFIDFLFNFLTIPIGSIEDVLKGNSGLGCIDNLYKSVENLDSKWFNTPPPNSNTYRCEENLKMILLKPGIAPNHKSKNLLLQIKEEIEPFFVDPRESLRDSNRCEIKKFAKDPSVFYVMDNLEVRPLSSTSTICLLQELNVPLHDIEERMISVGESEALSLLKASLTSSSSALTVGLNHMLKKLIDEDVKSS